MPAFVHCSSSRSGLASARSEDFSRIFCSPAICEASGCSTLASASLLLTRMGIPYGGKTTLSTLSTTATSVSPTPSRRRLTASVPATRGQEMRSPLLQKTAGGGPEAALDRPAAGQRDDARSLQPTWRPAMVQAWLPRPRPCLEVALRLPRRSPQLTAAFEEHDMPYFFAFCHVLPSIFFLKKPLS